MQGLSSQEASAAQGPQRCWGDALEKLPPPLGLGVGPVLKPCTTGSAVRRDARSALATIPSRSSPPGRPSRRRLEASGPQTPVTPHLARADHRLGRKEQPHHANQPPATGSGASRVSARHGDDAEAACVGAQLQRGYDHPLGVQATYALDSQLPRYIWKHVIAFFEKGMAV